MPGTLTASAEALSADLAAEVPVAAPSAAAETSAGVEVSVVEASVGVEVSVAAVDSMEAVEAAVSMEVAAEGAVRVRAGWIARTSAVAVEQSGTATRRSPGDVLLTWVLRARNC